MNEDDGMVASYRCHESRRNRNMRESDQYKEYYVVTKLFVRRKRTEEIRVKNTSHLLLLLRGNFLLVFTLLFDAEYIIWSVL